MSTTVSKLLKCYPVFFKKGKFINPPPLMFSWEIYEFFNTAIEHRWVAASVLTFLLSSDN